MVQLLEKNIHQDGAGNGIYLWNVVKGKDFYHSLGK